MPMDIRALLELLNRTNAFGRVVNNPLAQFGTDRASYLGATILPERLVTQNEFTESAIRFRAPPIANASTRFSPVQLKQSGALIGTFQVSLGNSDIGSQITAADYEALLKLLETIEVGNAAGGGLADAGGPALGPAALRLLNWTEFMLNRPLLEHNELNRWKAIVDASVTLTGDNNYTETIAYPNPTGSRVAAGGDWDSDLYDPWDDILAGQAFLAAKGYRVARLISGTPVKNKLMGNANTKNRGATVLTLEPGGTLATQTRTRMSLAVLNGLLAEDLLPPLEVFDTAYRTQSAAGYFLNREAMVMIGETDNLETFDISGPAVAVGTTTLAPEIRERLARGGLVGYTAIGRAAGQAAPGRVIVTEFQNKKPPGVIGEGWQTSLPIVTDPDAIYVITDID